MNDCKHLVKYTGECELAVTANSDSNTLKNKGPNFSKIQIKHLCGVCGRNRPHCPSFEEDPDEKPVRHAFHAHY